MDDPAVSIVVVIDEPRPYHFGGVVAAPVFKKVAQDCLRYLKVAPTQKALAKKGDCPKQ